MQSMALSQNAPEDAMPQTMSGWSKKAMRWYWVSASQILWYPLKVLAICYFLHGSVAIS